VRVFVTGGNGFIGSRVVRRLVEDGHEVRCLLRPSSRTHRIDDLALERVPGDLGDPDALRRGVAGCDGCVHLAGVSSWDEIASPEVEETIVGGTRRLLEAARGVPGLRLVYVSSVAAVNGSDGPRVFDESAAFGLAGSGLRYALAKHAAEELVREAVRDGLDAVTVNPGETYGPEDDEWVTAGPIRDVLRQWPALAVRGGASVVHVDDVAAGIVAALRQGRAGERYILGGDNLRVEEIVRTALHAAGSRKPVLVVPAAVLRAVVRLCVLLRLPPPVPPDLVGYACRFWFVDSGKAKRELGYRPRPAAETLGAVVAWIRGPGATAHP
jgi:dihydroflavonol-4-reductase